MKYLLLLATLVATLSHAQAPVAAQNVAEAKKQIAQQCKQGCLILTPEQVKAIEANINRSMNEIAQEAFEAGKKVCNKTI